MLRASPSTKPKGYDVAFILSADGRDRDVLNQFGRYRSYLQTVSAVFPLSAFDLATSDWYFDPRDHRCPHDAWVEEIQFRESASGDRSETRILSLYLRLLGAYHDGYIELRYPKIHAYALGSGESNRGHGDWRYDELRLSARGHLIHEIEWSSGEIWRIEASDLELTWIPKASLASFL